MPRRSPPWTAALLLAAVAAGPPARAEQAEPNGAARAEPEVAEPAGWGLPPEVEPVAPGAEWGLPPPPAPEAGPPVEPTPPAPDPPAPAPAPPAPVPPAPETDLEVADRAGTTGASPARGFGFGSYGRVGAGTDLRGSTARPVSVVAHGPRVVEPPYLELDLYYDLPLEGPWGVRTVATLALLEDLFHYTGEFSSMLALRNAYASFTYRELVEVWAGSRMYRGDDIYLLDFWPLDNLNTVGAGVALRRDRLELRVHAGVNRLADDYQFQEIQVPGRLFGAERVVWMDRQRTIASLGGSYRVLGAPGGPALRVKAYFELHHLAAGTLRREDLSEEALPSDLGWVGGLQLGAWGFGDRLSHANLFLRFGQGLGAYNEMAIPFGLDEDKRTFPRANELVLGFSANWERGIFGLLAGGYARRFVDADPNVHDPDDGWELVVDLRPWVVLWGPLQLALDLSYQQRFPSGMSPSALELLEPAVFQLAPMVVFAPLGPGSYARPHVRLVYRMAYLSEGALDLYPAEDPRHDQPLVHYLGVQVEWWFNSSYR